MKILVFEQDNCGWCVRLHPHIKKMSEEINAEIEFINITDNWDEYVIGYDLRTTPTVVIENDGIAVRSFSIKIQGGIAGLMREIKDFING
jgi:thiol-disulfide isomerase/thioredoxin